MLKHVNENRMMTSPQGNGDGDVYAFGINRNGELGMKDKAPKVTPQLVSSNMKKRIVSVSAGLNYSVALTTKGTMYAWGVNEFGNLGVKDTKNRNVPTRVRGLKNKKVWKISAGACHCLAVTEQGELYSWGRNACGELGLKDVVNRAKPTLVDSFGGKKVMNVMAGFDFSVCVTEDGMIYAWGGNAHGQCCAGDLKNRNQARKISCSGKVIPAKIVIGGQHGLMLTDKGHVYSWGRNQCGQLGVGGFADTANMVLLPVLQTKQVTSVYAGANFSVALTENGLYTWGGNHYGQLGLGDKSNRFIPALLVAMKSIPVERVFASSSAYHMFILDKEDRLHALGPNNFGQLGIENEESTPIIDDTDNYRELPEEVDFMRGRHVTSMALAQNHTITLVTNQLCSSPQKR
jgi:alpha-tubulin suppressor-like RCC1 family protein